MYRRKLKNSDPSTFKETNKLNRKKVKQAKKKWISEK